MLVGSKAGDAWADREKRRGGRGKEEERRFETGGWRMLGLVSALGFERVAFVRKHPQGWGGAESKMVARES
jgi:hypothetical protein